jgi:hypothetical protein
MISTNLDGIWGMSELREETVGGLFMRRLPRIAAQISLIAIVSKRPRRAKLYRALIACALCVSIGFLYPRSVAAEIVTEDFEAYPLQSDTTGVIDVEEDGTFSTEFRITTTGTTGATDPTVAIVFEGLAASAGVAAEGGNKFWTLGSSAGQTGPQTGPPGTLLLIGDIPGFGDPTGGPIGAFFSFPRDLTGATISARVREKTGAAATQFRFLLEDSAERVIVTTPFLPASGTFPLTTAFQTFTVPITAFTISFPGEEPFDFTKVISVGFEFFITTPGTPATVPAFSFNVDDIQLDDAPEPAKAMPWLLLLLD